MTIETTYGYKLPELGDVDFFTSWNFNFSRLDGHDHDGENSKILKFGAGVLVSTEEELDQAIADVVDSIVIAASFEITGRKTLYSGLRLQAQGLVHLLTGIGIIGSQSMFDIPAGVVEVIMSGLSLTTAQTDIDLISIQDTAIRNLISDSVLTIPSLTTSSVIYVNGQQNKIVANNSDFAASVSSPGNIFLDANSAENVVNANIIT